MKHFVLEGEYLVPFEELSELIPKHRAFLQKGYDASHFCARDHRFPRVEAS